MSFFVDNYAKKTLFGVFMLLNIKKYLQNIKICSTFATVILNTIFLP